MNGRPPLDVAVVVEIEVWLPIPASMSKKNRAAALAGDLLPAKRPDLSNIVKGVEDGMNGVVLRDDSLIVWLLAHKGYGERPGVSVLVRQAAQK
jgi:Holliday junction resolvase RusA-like endonuclease